jgi:hypothetical protein
MKKYDLVRKVHEFEKTRLYISEQLQNLNQTQEYDRKVYITKMPEYTLNIKDVSGLYKNDIDFKSKISIKHNKSLLDKSYFISSMNLTSTLGENSFFESEKERFSRYSNGINEKIQKNLSYVEVNYKQGSDQGYTYRINGARRMLLKENYKVDVKIETADVNIVYPFIKTVDNNISINQEFDIHNKTKHTIMITEVEYSLKHRYSQTKKIVRNKHYKIKADQTLKVATARYEVEKHFKDALIFKNITIEDLKNTKITFGVKVKYRALNSKKVYILTKDYSTNAYSLLSTK